MPQATPEEPIGSLRRRLQKKRGDEDNWRNHKKNVRGEETEVEEEDEQEGKQKAEWDKTQAHATNRQHIFKAAISRLSTEYKRKFLGQQVDGVEHGKTKIDQMKQKVMKQPTGWVCGLKIAAD